MEEIELKANVYGFSLDYGLIDTKYLLLFIIIIMMHLLFVTI